MDFARVIKTDRLLRIVIVSLLILIAGVTALAWGGDVSRDLLKRSLFLSDIPVPRKTRVYPITDNLLIALTSISWSHKIWQLNLNPGSPSKPRAVNTVFSAAGVPKPATTA